LSRPLIAFVEAEEVLELQQLVGENITSKACARL
jgi:hypothetical protein